MLNRVESLVRSCRRFFSRSEWVIRLLGLEVSRSTSPGLVLVQIDGLSHDQLKRALDSGRMPFLKTLITKERHGLHVMYSGLPSNTPAFQGELFYGVKTCVPAFSFIDKETGKVFKMFEPASAETLEKELSEKGEGLLKGGSAYSNIFSGGAEEPHFCASKLGWGSLLRAGSARFFYPLLVVLYVDIFIRTVTLFALELLLAVVDCVRGTIAGKLFWQELKFIPARVSVCVLLREFVVMGALVDVARGLPVVQLNLLGYDEQSHRRGPSSQFAHWSLGGIDHSIQRIWNATTRSRRRDFDLWVYSDHGQEHTQSYQQATKLTLESAVAKVFEKQAPRGFKEPIVTKIQSEGMRLLHNKVIAVPVKVDQAENPDKEKEGILLTAMGPVGHVYLTCELERTEKEALAESLVNNANIPLVMATLGPDRVEAWTTQGKFTLPDEADKIFGPTHPFLEELRTDILALCHHAHAGTFVLFGWHNGHTSMSFPFENGAHAGAGIHETNAFAIVSPDATLRFRGRKYLRATDLREAARRYMGRPSFQASAQASRQLPADVFRLITYNVHGCRGMDNKVSPERIARVLARHEADAVCLQELDVFRQRSGGIDQADTIAKELQMQFHFQPVFCVEDEKYGNAILSRFPMKLIRMEALPSLPGRKGMEPRGAMWVEVEMPGAKIQLISCHLSVWPSERLVQAESLMGKDWLGHPDCKGPVMFCGDLNALPRTASYKKIVSKLRDCQLLLEAHRPRNTFFGRYPMGRLDHVFVGPGIEVVEIKVPTTELDKVASDHLPLVVDLRIPGTSGAL